jgi:hypothetical protein
MNEQIEAKWTNNIEMNIHSRNGGHRLTFYKTCEEKKPECILIST